MALFQKTDKESYATLKKEENDKTDNFCVKSLPVILIFGCFLAVLVLAVVAASVYRLMMAKEETKNLPEEKKCQNDQVCCEDGWTPFGKNCYTFVDEFRTWTQAEDYCKTKFNAHLTSITSYEEQEFVLINTRINCKLCDDTFCWIGATDAESEGTWTWSDGTAWSYTAWRTNPREPSNSGGDEHYAYAAKDEQSGIYWNDAPNRLRAPFACKLQSK